MVKILFTVHQFFPDHRAGVEIVTLGLAQELRSRGHEPYVFAASGSPCGGWAVRRRVCPARIA
jgi:hypothetical protein